VTVAGETALYRIFGDADVLLYIGISDDFGRRWKDEAKAFPWWNERRHMTVDWYPTRDDALDTEALAIFAEQPKYNVMHRKQARRLHVIQRRAADARAHIPPRAPQPLRVIDPETGRAAIEADLPVYLDGDGARPIPAPVTIPAVLMTPRAEAAARPLEAGL
jgi:hypothetical protein